MSDRFEVRPFSADLLDDAARLLAERHRLHRAAEQALDPAYESVSAAGTQVAALAAAEHASGAVAFRSGRAVAYVLGTRRSDSTWGANIWIEDAGSAAHDAESLREAYALASAEWVAAGRTNHFVNVPATDTMLVGAWFSLDFGQQHVHAVREHPSTIFEPALPPGLVVRPPARPDIPELAQLELILPRHQMAAPVFSRLEPPGLEQAITELEADFEDPRFAVFVAEHDGRVLGSAVGTSIEVSSTNTALMRPASAGFLGFAAVLPEARGLGTGRALSETVMCWSRDAGYEWFTTDWRSTNLAANRTWRALGFRPTFVRLHRAIN